jgi:hypothetical protein
MMRLLRRGEDKMNSKMGRYTTQSAAVLFVALVIGFSTRSQAQVTTNLSSGGSISFTSLVGSSGDSVQIGDKLFGNFSFQYLDTDNNMGDDLSASALVLSSLSNGVGFGVSIQLPLVATGVTIKDVTIQFTATVLDPNQKISDVHLAFTGSASGQGISEVSESIFTNGFGNGNLANLSLTETSSGFTPASGESVALLSIPQTKIWIEKDVVISGNPNAVNDGNPPTDFASITIINQTFSQIPEPSTIVLALAGLSTFAFLKRRK